eukprot:TRINITY_DN2957_c0_g1_i1.p1 TRINITY_DN2957_c0_g1~~TRINITY_DN2957_c0_g1_i1.p1  ORF type:complete len:255 (+),score=19.33 TRINITY_DN2957_c0_g1_i1:120-884(+)
MVMRTLLSQASRSLQSVQSCQKRWKPFKALKWTNDRTMRDGLKQVNKPWEVRSDYDFVKGDFGLVATRGGHITEKQLENVMLYIKANFRSKEFKVTINDEYQIHPLSRRAQGAKMGKGLGDQLYWVLRIRPGTVIVDVKARFPEVMGPIQITRFFKGIIPLLGVPTTWASKGMVNVLDDIDYASSQVYLDKNSYRRLQDAYPEEAYKKHYYTFAENEKNSPKWTPHMTRFHYPVFQGKKFPNSRSRFVDSRYDR